MAGGKISLVNKTKKKIDLSRVPVHSLIEFDACTKCGECSLVCPTGGESEVNEKRTPRGKIRSLKRIQRIQNNPIRLAFTSDQKLQGLLDDLSRNLYECSICGMCSEACPFTLRTIDMWESLRNSLVVSGLGPLGEHESLVKSIENYDNPWMQPRTQRTRWAKKYKNIIDATKEEIDILYYVGCTASYDPEVSIVANNLAKILAFSDRKVGILGKDEKCCGSTLLRLGEIEKAKRLAVENTEMFRKTGAKRIVVACAGCYKTLVQDYPKLTGIQLPVVHVTQLLADLLSNGRIPLNQESPSKVVTYHDPCHLGRHTHLYEWPREVLRLMPGIELVEMERTRERSRCCGAGGGLKTLAPELVIKIAEKRIEDAEATGATLLVTSCPFCMQTLVEAARRKGSSIKVIDITELVIERLMS